MNAKFRIGCLLAFLFARMGSGATVPAPVVTVYSSAGGSSEGGFALVEERRVFDLVPGYNRVLWEGFPRAVDANSIQLLPEEEGVRVLAQTFLPATEESQLALAKYVGQHVRVHPDTSPGQVWEGTLLASGPRVLLRDAQGGIHVFADPKHVEIPSGDAVARMGVIWEVEAQRGGRVPAMARYETAGFDWHAQYTVTLQPGADSNRGVLDLAGAFLVENRTEVSWHEARLYLIAGDVHRPLPRPKPQRMFAQREVAALSQTEGGVKAEAAGEHYEYAVPRAVSLPAGSVVRVEGLGTWGGIPYEQELICRNRMGEWFAGRGSAVTEREPGGSPSLPVEVFLRFRNAEEGKPGVPLPAGIVRVGERRADQARGWRFLGAADVPATPVGEKVVIPLGTAFDVSADRKQTDFLLQNEQRRMEEAVEVTVRNRKDLAVRVRVLETLYRAAQWEITESAPKFSRLDARTIEFVLDVPARGQSQARYRVRYTW
ncbi:MAG: hypothetical protein KatS3mg077_3244 [Candidatus Binatia bacterium]|nr:MAG: hypothetical protein KatS3mg077_3244 [Candidatus Binatia bacterium]